MFLPNDVLQYAGPLRTIRVLWIDRERAIAYSYELGLAHSQPRTAPLQALVDDVVAQRARLLPHDPWAAPPPPPGLPQKYRDVQARAWDIVSALQAHAPGLYEPRTRALLVARCAGEYGMSRPSVLRYLRRYWERGQTIDALLPDYGNSGAPGKTRGASEGVKRGRPRKSADHPGLNTDAIMRATFRAAVARHAAMHAVFSRRAAYRQMLDEFYRGHAPGTIPSYGQFSYWLDKDGAPPERRAAHRPQAAAVQPVIDP